MRRVAFVSLVVLLAMAGCGGSARPVRSARYAPASDVVVLLVVDQFSGWAADALLPHFPPGGGFARLLRDGGGLRFLELAHSVTDTGPGHAALMTGRVPRDHGIVADERLLADGRVGSFLFDADTRVVTTDGPTDRPASSLAVLRVETLADRFRGRRPDANIVSLSLEDRAALFGGGRLPDAVLYLDGNSVSFVTSTAFAQALPAWARPHASVASVAARLVEPWQMLDPDFFGRGADLALGEGDVGGFGVDFPHRFVASSRPELAFRASPRGDEALVDLALASLASAANGPRLLVVSFSGNEYAGHIFGPSSAEVRDVELRLDRQLARLFSALDARFGADGYSVVLSADHGATPGLPEQVVVGASCVFCGIDDRFDLPCNHAVRVDPAAIGQRLEAAAQRELGAGPFIAGFVEPYVHFTERGRDVGVRDRLGAIVVRELGRERGVERALTLPAACDDAENRFVCASTIPGFGDVYVLLESGAFFDSGYVPGFGGGHGSHARHDRVVPFLARLSRSARDRGISIPGRAEDVLAHDAYFALADRLLGGDGRPSEP